MSLEVEVALVFFGTSSERPEFNNHNQKVLPRKGSIHRFPCAHMSPRLRHVFYHLAQELPAHALILPEIHLCTLHASQLWFLSQGMASSSEQKHIFPHS